MTAATTLTGVGVCAGVVVGPVRWMPGAVPEPVAGQTLAMDEREPECLRLVAATTAVQTMLDARADAATGTARAVLEATALMAADPSLQDAATGHVRERGLSAERAVWEAAGEVAAMIEALGGYLAERARDVLDVRDRIVAELTGRPAPGVPEPVAGQPFVLLAHDLAPADTATLSPESVLALVTVSGGPTSHTAIIARSLGLPAVVAVADAERLAAAGELADGTLVLVDGAAGTLLVAPDDEAQARARRLASGRRRTLEGPGRTADGVRVSLLANVADGASARAAAAAGAEGIGLFRTELAFLDRTDPPSVDEQAALYADVFAAFAGRRVVLRTLDAGSDKPLPFLDMGEEPNPALGVRGLRTALRAPQVLEDQLAAVARAVAGQDPGSAADVWVMAPMVSTADAADGFVARCAAHGITTAGVMVEVPSAALCSAQVLANVAFASIGTNDLTQYALAADRLVGDLATLNDPWQPGLLHLVAATCRGAAGLGPEGAGIPVGVCGEAAADPALACVLVGLGVRSLSMSAAALPDVAAALAGATSDLCREAAAAVLTVRTATEARAAARALLTHLPALGL
ncbi:phosphoenolpyruvate--protein phosphotransferase [Kineosporia sp. A_224]|uniref:phosphoenolpyruvate--protein phosphotransferase n=1 Tax=Kineosporia sp. A_224 TaxID=1962180 RepID=UPI000B4B30AC|nr:putative PEP-binding protein [Kineosporia sp. A_224]